MKRLKQQALYLGAMLLAGITMTVIGYMGNINSMMAGMGTAMTVVCVINLLKLRSIAKDPKRLREMELVQQEERLIFISDKASKAAFTAAVGLEYAALLVMVFLRKEETASALGFLVCGQLLLYVLFNRIYSKKY